MSAKDGWTLSASAPEDGSVYTELDLASGSWDFGPITHRLGDDMSVTLRQLVPFDSTDVLHENYKIKIADSGDVWRFRGRIEAVRSGRSSGVDEITYECKGTFNEAADTTFTESGNARVAYNVIDKQDPDYSAANKGKTVGQILEDAVDPANFAALPWANFTDDQDQLTQDSLPGLSVEPGKAIFNGETIPGVLSRLLSEYEPHRKAYIAGNTLESLVIVDTREGLDTLTINRTDVSEFALNADFEWRRTGVYSAVEIQGDWEKKEIVDYYDGSAGDISPTWDGSYEEGWTGSLALVEPETYGRVYREFELSQDNVLPVRISASDTYAMFYKYAEDQYYLGTIENLDLPTGKFRTRYPMLDDDGNQLEFWVRYAYRDSRLNSRVPAAGYSGSAYTATGIERCKYIVDEDYKKITVNGTVTRVGTNMLIDHRLLATPGQLVGASVVYNASGEGTVTDNSWFTIVTSNNTSGAVGEAYTLTVENHTSDLNTLAQALFDEVSQRNFSGGVTITDADMSKYRLGTMANFVGWDNTDWDTLEGVVTSVETDVWRDETNLEFASLSSIGANREYQQLKELLWNHGQTEENEIQLGRMARSSSGSKASTGSLGKHGHTSDSDGGPLSARQTSKGTLWLDEDSNEAVYAMDYSGSTSKFQGLFDTA